MRRVRRRQLLGAAGAVAATACLPWQTQPSPAPVQLTSMSIEERVGQLMIVAFHGKTITPHLERMIHERKVGGVIIFAENIEEASGLQRLAGDLQQIAREAGGGYPLHIAIDHEGGSVVRVDRGLTVLPSAMALAATPEPAANTRVASTIAARELRTIGVTWNLAPVADVLDEPRNAILLNRSFGSDPERVATLVETWVNAHWNNGLLPCVKHFPGHGSTTVDPHSGLPELTHDRARLDRVELVPFPRFGTSPVMTAHIVMRAIDPERPATLSARILRDLLRSELKFQGLTITDDLEMDALRSFGSVPEVALAASQAGADVLLFRYDEEAQTAAHRLLVEAAQDGRLEEHRLNETVTRILASKRPPRPIPTPTGLSNKAPELAREAMTLLRNDRVVPLRGRIAAFSVTQPDLSLLPDTLSVGEALREKGANVEVVPVPKRPSPTEIAQAVATARERDTAVVATADLLSYPEQAELVRAVAAARPTVLVSMRSPYDVMSAPDVPAYVCAYYGRPDAARATADLLLGKIRPRGKIPVTIPGIFPIYSGLESF